MNQVQLAPLDSLRRRLRQALIDRDRGELDYYAAAVELAAAEQGACCGDCAGGATRKGSRVEELRVRTWWAYDALIRLNRDVVILEAELDQWRT